jgi:chromatin segregation and condensation protein Rec8/ScpA/Scc1 (kleisin family)
MVVKRETFSVVVKMNYLLRELRHGGSLSFFALVERCQPLEIVVTFLAALELVRAHKARYEQSAPFGDIILQAAPKESVAPLAESA